MLYQIPFEPISDKHKYTTVLSPAPSLLPDIPTLAALRELQSLCKLLPLYGRRLIFSWIRYVFDLFARRISDMLLCSGDLLPWRRTWTHVYL